MDKMDGVELSKVYRTINKNIPIIMITGECNYMYLMTELSRDIVNCMILKPLSKKSLNRGMNGVLKTKGVKYV